MPSRQVTIQGVMTWDEPTAPIPPDPNAPRPSHPIALPGHPWWGGGGPVDPGYSPPWAQLPPGWNPRPDQGLPPFPSHPIVVPPGGVWPQPPGPVDPGYSPPWAQVPDPNAPRPSHPIMLPGMPGFGQWPNVPTHPIMLPGMPGWPTTPPVQPPTIEHPPAFQPIGGGEPGPLGQFTWYWSPVYGWVLGVPVEGGGTPPPTEPPPTEPPPEPV